MWVTRSRVPHRMRERRPAAAPETGRDADAGVARAAAEAVLATDPPWDGSDFAGAGEAVIAPKNDAIDPTPAPLPELTGGVFSAERLAEAPRFEAEDGA